MKENPKRAVLFAILAAILYAMSSPFSKILLHNIPATMLAAFLYLGAGLGMSIVRAFQKRRARGDGELPLTKQDLPYVIGMVVLDIAAPVFMMVGLARTTAANVALLNNFEIVATALIALGIYKEAITKRLWLAIAFVTCSSVLLSVQDGNSFSFSMGSLFVLLACICWGFENNCTRKLSAKNPFQIVVIKGLCSGTGALLLALGTGERVSNGFYICPALALGFVAYGLSISFYIYAQRGLGAAKTSTYYAIAPFVGAFLSLLLFREMPSAYFVLALLLMGIGTYFASTE